MIVVVVVVVMLMTFMMMAVITIGLFQRVFKCCVGVLLNEITEFSRNCMQCTKVMVLCGFEVYSFFYDYSLFEERIGKHIRIIPQRSVFIDSVVTTFY